MIHRNYEVDNRIAKSRPITPSDALNEHYTNEQSLTPPSSQSSSASRRFSFNKRPVLVNPRVQRKSSHISVIHNYPAQKCDTVTPTDSDHSLFYSKYRGILHSKEVSVEFNYDEKIRAPRMSLASIGSRDNLKLKRLQSAPIIASADQMGSSYKPASYDLTSYLRRLSMTDDQETNYIFAPHTTGSSTPSETTLDTQLIKPVEQIDEPTKLLDNYIPPLLRETNPADLDIQHPDNIPEPLLLSSTSSSYSNTQLELHPVVTTYSRHAQLKSSLIEPSRSHWKANALSTQCDNTSCQAKFTFFKRRHHCRRCGGIFCSQCLSHVASLNVLAHFEKGSATKATCSDTGEVNVAISNEYSTLCKVCPGCYTAWIRFLVSDDEFEGKVKGEMEELGRRKESVSSGVGITTDWNWSSF